MNHSYYSITLDVKAIQSQVTLPVKQGDTSRGVYISLTDGGKPYTIAENCFATFKGEKSDGTEVGNNCVIKNNRICYDFTEQTVASPGIVACEVSLYEVKLDDEDNGLITSPRFTLLVDPRAVGGDEYKSTDEYGCLEGYLTELGNAVATFKENEANRASTFEENEVERQVVFEEAEAKRQETVAAVIDENSTYEQYASAKGTYELVNGLNQGVANSIGEKTYIKDITDTLGIKDGYGYNNEGGCYSKSGGRCTELFKVNAGEKYYVSGTYTSVYVLIAQYDDTIEPDSTITSDALKSAFISAYTPTQSSPVTDEEYIVPDGVAYIACTTFNASEKPLVVKKEVTEFNNVQEMIDKEVDVLHRNLEENNIYLDKTQSFFTFEVDDTSKALNLKPSLSLCEGTTKIEWGDGTETAITTESVDVDYKHWYAEPGMYTVIVHGLTSIGALAFRDSGAVTVCGFELIKAILGANITSIGNLAFGSNALLTEIKMLSSVPATLGTTPFNRSTVNKIYVPKESIFKYRNLWSDFTSSITTDEDISYVLGNTVVTVGENGDFQTISDALQYWSTLYPIYKRAGISCEIRILSGTIITEQIAVQRIDLSYITITSEDAEVPVDTTGWGSITHDSRGDAPFFWGEYAAKLPCIGTVFKRTAGDSTQTVGYFCNRGSSGVVLPSCGFDGFYDNVIANNEASITIREGVARNASRWGVHARHNGEVSARSTDLTGCGIGACADRVGDLDVREATLDNSIIAIQGFNCSRVNANGTNITSAGAEGGQYIIKADGGSIINCVGIKITNPLTDIYYVEYGGMITTHANVLSGVAETIAVTNVTKNQLTSAGVILG